jgi:hypothetical protein
MTKFFVIPLLIIPIIMGKFDMGNSHQKDFNPADTAIAIQSFFALEGQMVTPQQITEQISTRSSLEHPDLGPILNTRGKLGTLWISPRNTLVYYSGNVLTGKNKSISASEAYNIATNFVARHVTDFDKRNFKADDPELDGESLTLNFTEHPRSGVETSIFPNWVEVVVDLVHGRIKRFSASDIPLYRTTPPKISKTEAEAKIMAEFEKAAIEDIELMEQPIWNQAKVITVWSALVLTLDPEGPITQRVTINADTGEILPE